MAAGKRDQLVTIQKSVETQSVGEPVRTWSTHARWWAEELPLGGSEGPAAGQVQYATRRRQWGGLFVAGVHEGMRLLLTDGTELDIDVVAEADYRKNRMVLVTTQRDTV